MADRATFPKPQIAGAPVLQLLAELENKELTANQLTSQPAKIARLRRLPFAGYVILYGALSLAQSASAQTVVPKTRSVTEIGKSLGATPVAPAADASTTAPGAKPTDRLLPDAPAATTQVAAPIKAATPPTISGIAIVPQSVATKVTIALSSKADIQVFTLADPYRLIIDAADVDFQLPASVAQQRGGLVQSLRFGLIAPGRSRVVIDLTGPAAIADNKSAVLAASGPVNLVLTLTPTTQEKFAANLIQQPVPAPPPPTTAWQPSVKKAENGKPVIVVDPGHGGIDGGALGANNVVEKELVLAVSKQLRQMLAASGKYDVRMTRTGDTFLTLDARVAMSRAAEASLFISIHADSVADAIVAKTAHGSTVYILAEQATNRAAQRLADKENAADARVGVTTANLAESEQIKSILTDLVQRETHNFSLQFRKLVVDRLSRERVLARDPARAAAFKVLRQDNTPAVLIELGFMTNEEEVQMMQTPAWQNKIARALTTAVDAFFDKRQPKSP